MGILLFENEKKFVGVLVYWLFRVSVLGALVARLLVLCLFMVFKASRFPSFLVSLFLDFLASWFQSSKP